MRDRALHGSFTGERKLPLAALAFFDAHGDRQLPGRRFRLPGTPVGAHEQDFRIGGGESVAARFAPSDDRAEHLTYRSHFLHMVPDARIVYSDSFALDGRLRWTSLVTLALWATSDGTRLRRSEQYAFLAVTGSGREDVAHLEVGTRLQLDGVAAALRADR